MPSPVPPETTPLIDHEAARAAARSYPRRGRFFWQRLFRQPCVRFVPVRMLCFSAMAVSLGVFVLLHTQRMDPTMGIPAAILANNTVNPSGSPPNFNTPMHAKVGDVNFTVRWFEQKIDHFGWLANDSMPAAMSLDANGSTSSVAPTLPPNASSPAPTQHANNSSSAPAPHPSGSNPGTAQLPRAATYMQRYLVNAEYWDPSDPRAAVFFYTGNEADVMLYANHTGLMWENARDFNALIVFAEHRYYGESRPFGDDFMKHLKYLTHEQALADYAALIYELQHEFDTESHPVIAFGGSYGGMLAAWFRMKYPSVVHGAIAASAPILAFPGYPQFKGDAYWKVVTQDANAGRRPHDNCVANVKSSWPALFNMSATDKGRTELSQIFRLCTPMTKEEQGHDLAMAVMVAFDTLAMGNFPYASSYLTNGGAELPAWPVDAACSFLAGEFTEDEVLLTALRDASFVFYNATQDLKCFKIPTMEDFDGIWDYQWCTEMMPQETYFDTNGETDMFWNRTVSMDEIRARCLRLWGTIPDPDWIRVSYGDSSLREATNIVFSNGKLDPWSSGGVRHAPKGSSLTIVEIEDGAHHVDLFFSNPNDTRSIKAARSTEMKQVERWIDEYVSGTHRSSHWESDWLGGYAE